MPPAPNPPACMGKEQKAVRGRSLVDFRVPSRAEADNERTCKTTVVGIGVTASVLAQSSVQGVLIL